MDTPSPSLPHIPGLHRFRREFWAIGIVSQSLQSIIEGGLTAPTRWIEAGPHSFLADPFGLVLPDGSRFIYAERLSYSGAGRANGRGEIAAASLGPPSAAAPPRFTTALRTGHHLSYPSVMRHAGRWLMFAECWEAEGLLAFTAEGPEGPWRLHSRMLPGVPVVDPTLVEHGGLWFLFCTRQDDGPLERLHLFTAPDPLGPWHPHPATPVKVDRGSARPAGPIFRGRDRRLYRPGQDCRESYGGALVIHRIEQLTDEVFHEVPYRRIGPLPGPWDEGLHTISPFGTETLIDGKAHRWSLLEPIDTPLRQRRAAHRRRAARNGRLPDG